MRTVPAGTGTRWRWLVAGLAAVTSATLLPDTPAQATPTSHLVDDAAQVADEVWLAAFTQPGDHQLVVPTRATQMTVTATGAGGGGGPGQKGYFGIPGPPGTGGGGGGTVICTITVNPDSTLYIHVGQGGLGGKYEDGSDSHTPGTEGEPSTLGTSPQSDSPLVRAGGGGGGVNKLDITYPTGVAPGGAGGSASCTESNVVTRPGTVGENEKWWSLGGSAGPAGSPHANCPAGSGTGGDGANGGSFVRYPGSDGNNGCLVVTY